MTMMPPLWLHLRFDSADRSGVGLWLPLFLVWLILLPIVVLVLAVTVIVDLALFLSGNKYHHYTALLLACFGVLNAARGLVVNVHADRTDVDIRLV